MIKAPEISLRVGLDIEEVEEVLNQLFIGKLVQYRAVLVDLMDCIPDADRPAEQRRIDCIDVVIKEFTNPSER
jgi:hypothetical protein